MTRDPDLQAALADARRELADRLRPRLVAGLDADEIAAGFVTWLAGRGLHLIPQPPVVRTGRGTPPPPEWRAAKDALTRKTRDEETR